MLRPWIGLIIASSLMLGCASAPPVDPTRIEDRTSALWDDWTPTPDTAERPAWPEGVFAFDHWRVRDDAFTEKVWVALFSVMSTWRQADALPTRAARGLDALLATLEPSTHAVELDIAFLYGPAREGAPAWEGVVVRLTTTLDSGARPTLSLVLRSPTHTIGPTHLTLWGAPSYKEALPFTASITDAGVQLAAWMTLPQRPRELEEVPSQTAFPPVMDLDDLEFGVR